MDLAPGEDLWHSGASWAVCRPRVPHGKPSLGSHRPASQQCSGSRGLAWCAQREMWSHPTECQLHQRLQEARVSSPLESPGERGPAASWL